MLFNNFLSTVINKFGTKINAMSVQNSASYTNKLQLVPESVLHYWRRLPSAAQDLIVISQLYNNLVCNCQRGKNLVILSASDFCWVMPPIFAAKILKNLMENPINVHAIFIQQMWNLTSSSSWELFPCISIFYFPPETWGNDPVWLILLGWVVQPSTRFNWDFIVNFRRMEQVPGHDLTSGMTCNASWNPHFHVVRGSGLLSGLKNHTVAVGMKVRFF